MLPALATAFVSVAVTVMFPLLSNTTPFIVLLPLSKPAVVAVVALPDNDAVIVPAAKFPLLSLATTLLAVFAVVASTAQVCVDPLLP